MNYPQENKGYGTIPLGKSRAECDAFITAEVHRTEAGAEGPSGPGRRERRKPDVAQGVVDGGGGSQDLAAVGHGTDAGGPGWQQPGSSPGGEETNRSAAGTREGARIWAAHPSG